VHSLVPALAVLGSIVSLCVGSSYAKTLFGEIGAEGATAFRVVVAAALLAVVWRPWRYKISRDEAKAIWRYGITLGLMNLCFYMSIRTLPIGIAISIEFMGPLVLAVCLSRRLIDFVWIGFAVLGLALLLPWQAGSAGLDPVGLMFVTGAGFCWALYIIFGKQAGKIHAGQATALGLSVAALVVLPFGIARAGAALLHPHILAVGSMVALLSSAVPYSLEMFALKRLSKRTFGILLSLEPAVGAVSGYLILSETLSAIQWIAVVSIIVASVGTTFGSDKEPGDAPLAEGDGVAPL
jgi:inner membrane transporter RhtA